MDRVEEAGGELLDTSSKGAPVMGSMAAISNRPAVDRWLGKRRKNFLKWMNTDKKG